MGLHRQQHLALVRRALRGALEEDFAGGFLARDSVRCACMTAALASMVVKKSRRLRAGLALGMAGLRKE